MDHTNHDMVQMLSQQIAIMLKSLVQTTIDSFILLVDQMTRIGDAMAIPQVQTQHGNLAQNPIALGGTIKDQNNVILPQGRGDNGGPILVN